MIETENPSPPGGGNGSEGPLFPSSRAFVVQLSRDVDGKTLLGRVEHITSGRSTRFGSREELVAFMHGVLDLEKRSVPGQPGDVDGPGGDLPESKAAARGGDPSGRCQM